MWFPRPAQVQYSPWVFAKEKRHIDRQEPGAFVAPDGGGTQCSFR